MKKYFISFILLFFQIMTLSINSHAVEFNDPLLNSQVKVQSTYYDKATKSEKTISGVGIVLKTEINHEDRFFVFTVSHLSQGDVQNSLKILKYNKSDTSQNILQKLIASDDTAIEVVGSVFVDNNLDFEIIEIKDPHLSFYYSDGILNWINENRRIYFKAANNNLPVVITLSNKFAISLPNRSNLLPEFELLTTIKNHMLAFFSLDSSARLINERRLSWNTDEMIIQNKFRKGLSGSPVLLQPADIIESELDQQYIHLEGLIKGFHRYFNKSYVLDKNKINSIWNSIREKLERDERSDVIDKKSNDINQVIWRMSNCNTYREFIDPSSKLISYEINDKYVSSGGGEGADSGGGEGADSADSASCKLNSDNELSSTVDLGMIYKNQPAVIFKNNNENYYANIRSKEYLEGSSESFEILDKIKLNNNLKNIIKQRLRNSNKYQEIIKKYNYDNLYAYGETIDQLLSNDDSMKTQNIFADSMSSSYNEALKLTASMIRNPEIFEIKPCTVKYDEDKNEISLSLFGGVDLLPLKVNGQNAQILNFEIIKVVLNSQNLSVKKAELYEKSNGKETFKAVLKLVSPQSESLNMLPFKLKLGESKTDKVNKTYTLDLKGLIAMDLDLASILTFKKSEISANTFLKWKEKYKTLLQISSFYDENAVTGRIRFSPSGLIFSKASHVIVSDSFENYDWPLVCTPFQE